MGHFCAIKARHLSDRPPKLSPFQAEALDTQFPANRLNSREIPKFDPLPSAQNRRKCRCHSGFLQNRSTKLAGKFGAVNRTNILRNRETCIVW
jgi:hypothetical protein